jgi:hypothetical protein
VTGTLAIPSIASSASSRTTTAGCQSTGITWPLSVVIRGSCRFPFIEPDLRKHLDALDEPAALVVFTSPDGAPLRHSNFYRRAVSDRDIA